MPNQKNPIKIPPRPRIEEVAQWNFKGILQLNGCAFCPRDATMVLEVGDGEYLSMRYPICSPCCTLYGQAHKHFKTE